MDTFQGLLHDISLSLLLIYAGGAFVLTLWLTVIFVMSSIELDAMDGT